MIKLIDVSILSPHYIGSDSHPYHRIISPRPLHNPVFENPQEIAQNEMKF